MTSTHDAIGQSKVFYKCFYRHLKNKEKNVLIDDHHETLVKRL